MQLSKIISTFNQPRAREDLRAALKRKDVGLSMDSPTQWYCTTDILEASLKMRPELDEYLLSTDDLHPMFQDDDDWDGIRGLYDLFRPFKGATMKFSASDSPTLHLSITYLTFLFRELQRVSSPQSVSRNAED